MGFRVRLALMLVAILVSVQALTWALVFEVTRRQSIAEGERQLAAAGEVFVHQLDAVSQRVADSVEVLAQDFPLRAAIAQNDRGTVLSALRNHGRRVGAERMLLLDLEGNITADTGIESTPVPRATRGDITADTGVESTAVPRATGDTVTADAGVAAAPVPNAAAQGAVADDGEVPGPTGGDDKFPFPDLLDDAMSGPVAAVVAIDGRAYWLVVVTVSAPDPLALIAAGIPIDDALLAQMQRLSTLPKNLELMASTGGGPWKVVARVEHGAPLAKALADGTVALPTRPVLLEVGGLEYVALARPFERTPGDVEMAAVLGYSLDEALGPFRSVTTLWVALVALGLVVGLVGALLIARGVSRPVEALAEAATRVAAGDYATPPPVRGHDELGRLAGAFATMTAAIGEREERIRFQALHDATTGLPNRAAAEARIGRLLAVDASPAALLMIGLARLPDVVKSMGHALGDRLMREAGARLQALAGGHALARAGDTQFLVWLPGAGRAEAINFAFRARDALGRPFHEGEASLDVAPAVGIALHPEHGKQASALLQHAEVALFAALGLEDPVSVYAPEQDPNRPERLELMGELRQAIDGNALELHYQPRLDLRSGRVTGVEGLVRWPHPRRGYVPPDDFVPLAEKSGNVRRLTRWVLASGIAQAQGWRTGARDLRVALNLSARDLDDADLPVRVSELLVAHGLPPERIILEVTESAVMGEPDAAIGVLRRLADQGIDIAIDDFGVGQSSLAYLRKLPVHELKVDRSFVRALGHAEEDRAIVRAIVDLGHRLGFKVTSEGVEDAAALDYLREIGCDHAQGYLIGRPLPVAALEQWVDAMKVPVPEGGVS